MTEITSDTPAVQRLRYAYKTGHLGFDAFLERLTELDSNPGADVSDLPALPVPLRRGGAPTPRPLDRRLLAMLARIGDPVQRCLHAGAAADLADEQYEPARIARITALVALHVHYGVPMAQCYTPFGILRRPFEQARNRAPADLPDYGSEENAWQTARTQHKVYEAARSRGDTGRLVRDVEVRALTDGKYGPKVSNADLARELKTSTARIAQIRTGRDKLAA